jgi:uncharacterized protein YkwD
MSWASHPTTEMPSPLVSPGGRHHGRRRGAVAAFLLVGLIALVVVGALFGPGLVGWPPPAAPAPAPATAAPEPSGLAESAGGVPTAAVTDAQTSPAAVAPTSSAVTVADSPTLEAAVFSLTNAERATGNCPALVLDPRLAAAARSHSADMAQTGYFGHTAPDGSGPADRMREAGYETRSGWAENIALGQPTANAVMAAWMGSEGHRANILNCDLKAIGIGAARSANGQLYWTQVFGGAV